MIVVVAVVLVEVVAVVVPVTRHLTVYRGFSVFMDASAQMPAPLPLPPAAEDFLPQAPLPQLPTPEPLSTEKGTGDKQADTGKGRYHALLMEHEVCGVSHACGVGPEL